MTIVATQDTRNAEWATSNSFGRKMLEKMGWKGDGAGLGKNQQGTSTHLRAVKRAESLGIGAETDAFGDSGWQQTNAAFHGVLANLKREHSNNSSSIEADDKESRKKRKKEEKKRKKKEEKRRAKAAANGGDTGSSSSGGNNGIRLAQNKVQAGHARKMREAKDLRNKSAQDMAAIFGVKADFYKQPREWARISSVDKDSKGEVEKNVVVEPSNEVMVAEQRSKEQKKLKKSREKKKRKHSSKEDTKKNKKKSKE